MSGGSTLTLSAAAPTRRVCRRIGAGVMAVSGSGTRVDVSGVTGGGACLLASSHSALIQAQELSSCRQRLCNAGAMLGWHTMGRRVPAVRDGRRQLRGTVRADSIFVGNRERLPETAAP